MNTLIAVACLLLSLFGLDIGHHTFVHHVRADGRDALHTRTTVQAGAARFECLSSASGRCHYAVTAGNCGSAVQAENAAHAPCTSAVAQRFAVDDGARREIAGLQRFRPYASREATMPEAACETPG
ncbi:MAG TPA: hypothetical protein VIG68_06145, partial [Lysobacter sp.]